MIVIRTCPKCGGDLQETTLLTNPPIPKFTCTKCGSSWQGERQNVYRIPLQPEYHGYTPIEDTTPTEITSLNSTTTECNTCSTDVSTGGAAGAILAALMKCYEGD